MSDSTGMFLATVLNNDDVERRGRVVLQVPELLGSSPSHWAEPIVPSPYRPNIGDLVYVQFVNGDLAKPVYSATKMLTADMIAALNIVIGGNASPITIDKSMWELPISGLGEDVDGLRSDLTDTNNNLAATNSEVEAIWGTFPDYRTRFESIIGATIRTHDGAVYGDKGLSLSPSGLIAWGADSLITFSIDSETGNVDTVGSFRTYHPDLELHRGIVMNADGLAGYSDAGNKTFEIVAATGAVLVKGPVVTDGKITGGTYETSAEAGVTAAGVRINDTVGLQGWAPPVGGAAPVRTFLINTNTGAMSFNGPAVSNASITATTFTGGTIQTSTTAGTTSGGIRVTSSALVAYSNAAGFPETFRISANSGAITMAGPVVSGGALTGTTFQTSAEAGVTAAGVRINTAGLQGWAPPVGASAPVRTFFLNTNTGALNLNGPAVSNASVTSSTITGGTIQTGEWAGTSGGGIRITSSALVAYSNLTGFPETFRISANTGAITMSGPVVAGGTLTGSAYWTSAGAGNTEGGIRITSFGLQGWAAPVGGSAPVRTFFLNASTGALTLNGPVVTGASITGSTVQTSATAGTSTGGLRINASGLQAWAPPVGGSAPVRTVYLNNATGDLDITGGALRGTRVIAEYIRTAEWNDGLTTMMELSQETGPGASDLSGHPGGVLKWWFGVPNQTRHGYFKPGIDSASGRPYARISSGSRGTGTGSISANITLFGENNAGETSYIHFNNRILLERYNRTGTSGGALEINNNGYVQTVVSSERYKYDIEPLTVTHDVRALLALEPVSFKYKTDGVPDVGFIAEQADSAGLTDFVIYNEEGQPESFRYSTWVAGLQQIVRHQHDVMQDLVERIELLEAAQ